MAVDSLPQLLAKLKSSLDSAADILPEGADALPPTNAISLLDVKNDLFLAYLQNLSFLILLKLRSRPIPDASVDAGLRDDVVSKLVELRVYLDRGVRPLESRLKYQIDKVTRAADTASQKVQTAQPATKTDAGSESSDEDEDAEDDEPDQDELSFRPNPSAFAAPSTSSAGARRGTSYGAEPTDVYRPPRITPVAPPTTDFDDRARRAPRRQERSRTMDDFVAAELSGAPTAEPSIGSTITQGGRRDATRREREDAAERAAYEEANLVRLPQQSKKDKARAMGRESRFGTFGGEELRGLGEGADRIERLTSKPSKRKGRDTIDGPRGSGVGGGGGGAGGKRRKTGGGRF